MSNVPSPSDAFETVVSAYASATTPADRRLYLRAALRRLEHDAQLHAEHMRLLMIASTGEGNA
jgi:hypothetical protein